LIQGQKFLVHTCTASRVC